MEASFECFLTRKQANALSDCMKSASSKARTFLLGALTLILTGSVNMKMLSVESRSRTFSSPANGFASAGFFEAAGRILRCFHCNCSIDSSDSDPPLRLHSRASPNCFLQRLLRIIEKDSLGLLDSQEVAADSLKFARALKKLNHLLQNPMLTFVESFGFVRRHVEFAVARHFMTKNGEFPDSPGEIIRRLQEEADVASQVGGAFDFRQLVETAIEDAQLESGRFERAQATASAGEMEAGGAAAASESKVDFGDPNCTLCKVRQRNRVLLPCGHMRFCDKCVSQMSACPACNAQILAAVETFIS